MTRLILDNVTISVVVYSELANPKRHFPNETFDLQPRNTDLKISPSKKSSHGTRMPRTRMPSLDLGAFVGAYIKTRKDNVKLMIGEDLSLNRLEEFV